MSPVPTALTVTGDGRLRRALVKRVGGLPVPFWWLWLGTLVNRAGSFIEPFAVLYLTGPRHLSVPTAGFVVTVWGVGGLLSQPIGGLLTDRVGRRFTLAAGLLGTSCALGFLAVARGVPVIVAAAFVLGVVGDLYRPAAQAVVADLLSGEQRVRGFALQFWAINLGFSVATLSAGLLARAGFGVLFVLDALTTALFALIVLRMVPETRSPGVGVPDGPSALSLMVRDRLLLLAFGLALTYAVLYNQVYLTLPLAVRDAGLSTASYGLVIAVNGIAIVALQPLVLPWLSRIPRTVLMPVSMLFVAGGLALSGLCRTTPQFAGTVVLWTLGEIAQSTVLSTLVAELAPVHLRGRYLGAFGLAWGASGLVGPLIGAPLYAANPAWVWWGCAGVGVLAAGGHYALARVSAERLGTTAASTGS